MKYNSVSHRPSNFKLAEHVARGRFEIAQFRYINVQPQAIDLMQREALENKLQSLWGLFPRALK